MDHRPPRPDQPYAWDDERLSAYLDGELSAPEQAQLEARLVVDPELRQLVDELRAVRQQLEILPEYHLQATFAEQVLRRAEQEMLLSPVARETTSVSIAAATTAMPTVPATSVESPVTPLPRQSLARRWQRGVIWTAVAAAAVLLLIVTNRPHGPDQNPVARHDDPDTTVTVEHGAAKPGKTSTGTANIGPPAAKTAAPQDGAVERQVLDKLQRDANRTARDPAADAPLAKIEQQSDAQKAIETQPFAFPNPNNGPVAAAAPKPADGLATKPADPQLPQVAGGKQPDSAAQVSGDGQVMFNDASDKRKSDATRGKMLLKNQAFGAAPGTQAGTRRKELSADLTTFFASEDFKQLMLPRDDKKRDEAKGSQDEQILVVYLTPRAEPTSDRSFESLLASNSIELSEKTLGQAMPESRQRLSAAPTEPGSAAGEPLAKAFSGKAEAGEAKDRKATDLKATDLNATDLNKTDLNTTDARGASKSQAAAAEAKQLQDKSVVPESHLSAAYNAPAANELYYLEADESQVQELLRQLRVAPDRFTRLSVASRELPQTEERADLRQEQSLGLQSSPATAGQKRSEAAAASALSGADENGKQQPLASGQLAQGTAPAAPLVVAQAPAVPAPAAETQTAPLAAQAPAAPAMGALPTPQKPSGAIPKAAPAAAGAAPASTTTNDVLTPKAEAFSASPGKSNAGQANENLSDADSGSNRRALAMDQQLQATGERVIAYRLRGVEGLTGASSTPAMNRGQEPAGAEGGGVAVGGGGGFGNAKPGNAPLGAAMEKTEPAKNGYVQESGDAGQQNSSSAIPGQQAKSGKPAPALAEAKGSTDPLQADANEALRMLTQNKETEERIHEKSPAEAAKKSAAPAPKRVRVLFVIEHEPAK